MRLSHCEDSLFQPSEDFSIEVKNKKVYFQVYNERYVFGSKLYPVGKHAEIFVPDEYQPQEKFQEIIDLVHNSGWQPTMGGCYAHAEFLQGIFKNFGVDAKYFSGWVFASGGFPIHHAWVVVGGRVYDLAVNMTSMNYIRELELQGENPWEEKHLRRIKEINDKWRPIDEHFTWGQAKMIYVGSETDGTRARREYNKAIDNAKGVANHPSYRHMKKKSRYEASPLQESLRGVGANLHN